MTGYWAKKGANQGLLPVKYHYSCSLAKNGMVPFILSLFFVSLTLREIKGWRFYVWYSTSVVLSLPCCPKPRAGPFSPSIRRHEEEPQSNKTFLRSSICAEAERLFSFRFTLDEPQDGRKAFICAVSTRRTQCKPLVRAMSPTLAPFCQLKNYFLIYFTCPIVRMFWTASKYKLEDILATKFVLLAII